MMKKRKIVFVLLICTIIVVSTALIFRIIMEVTKEEAVNTASSSMIVLESEINSSNSDNDEVKFSSESSLMSDRISPDVDILFQNNNLVLDRERMTVVFDDLIFCIGMSVRDIVSTSEWYSLRADDILQPDETGYLILNNDTWTSFDIQLNNDTNVRNGEIVLWVHNYGNEPMRMFDCTVYKYKINYTGCFDVYTKQPMLSYLNKYYLGYKGVYSDFGDVENAVNDAGTYIRHIFGDIDSCQVIADSNDRDGLFAITVFCNEIYGPDFEMKGDDIIEQ